MATLVLVPGAGSDSWYWHRVVPLLEADGHEVVAVDLPCDDDAADLRTYTGVIVDAIAARVGTGDVVLVAQSMGALSAPLVCEHLPVALILLVAAMSPIPGEPPGAWWDAVGQPDAARAFAVEQGRDPDDDDPVTVFLHDVPDEVAAASADHLRPQSGTPFAAPWPAAAWPAVPTRFLLCTEDRLFPPALQRRIVPERLGIVPDELTSGHLPALAHPDELVDWVRGCLADLERP